MKTNWSPFFYTELVDFEILKAKWEIKNQG